MELYISDHPLDCLTCSANGDCELQDMAGVVGLREVRYGYRRARTTSTRRQDTRNPYFDFDASQVHRLLALRAGLRRGPGHVRADDRGPRLRLARSSAGAGVSFMESECVSCGACVQACPTATLQEKSVVELGMPTRSVITTCAYCGVGCSFKAELRGDELVRMVPYKDGGANEGHSCVKGRFAFGYATPPGPRAEADDARDDHRRVARGRVGRGDRLRRHGGCARSRPSTAPARSAASPRRACTNEEVYVVQKMVRAAFGNNNVDTCARVCHSPTGYGLKQTFGTSAGTQDFKSVDEADVILVIGANPTDGHPVFASRMKQRLREGAKLIVVDPRRIDLVRTPHIEAAHHLQLAPGHQRRGRSTRWRTSSSPRAWSTDDFVAERCEGFEEWAEFIAPPENSPEAIEPRSPACRPTSCAPRPGCTRPAGNAAIYYGLGVTEHSQGSTMVMGMANLAMATGNIGRDGVGVNPLRGQNNVQGSCDMGSFPHELPGYRHVSDDAVRDDLREALGHADPERAGPADPEHVRRRDRRHLPRAVRAGRGHRPVRPEHPARARRARRRWTCVVVQDLFLNETAKFAHVFLPGTSFLEKDGTFTNAERRINRVRPVMAPHDRQARVGDRLRDRPGDGLPDALRQRQRRSWTRSPLTTPTFAGVSFDQLDKVGSVQWPCNDDAPDGHADHARGRVRARQGHGSSRPRTCRPSERSTRKFPLILTTGRILTQYNVGAQTRRTANVAWHPEDILEIHPHDAEVRGINDGDTVALSQPGRRDHAARQDRPTGCRSGCVYTTFHHPVTGANVVTTEQLRLGDQLPGVQGDRRPGRSADPADVHPVRARAGHRWR